MSRNGTNTAYAIGYRTGLVKAAVEPGFLSGLQEAWTGLEQPTQRAIVGGGLGLLGGALMGRPAGALLGGALGAGLGYYSPQMMQFFRREEPEPDVVPELPTPEPAIAPTPTPEPTIVPELPSPPPTPSLALPAPEQPALPLRPSPISAEAQIRSGADLAFEQGMGESREYYKLHPWERTGGGRKHLTDITRAAIIPPGQRGGLHREIAASRLITSFVDDEIQIYGNRVRQPGAQSINRALGQRYWIDPEVVEQSSSDIFQGRLPTYLGRSTMDTEDPSIGRARRSSGDDYHLARNELRAAQESYARSLGDYQVRIRGGGEVLPEIISGLRSQEDKVQRATLNVMEFMKETATSETHTLEDAAVDSSGFPALRHRGEALDLTSKIIMLYDRSMMRPVLIDTTENRHYPFGQVERAQWITAQQNWEHRVPEGWDPSLDTGVIETSHFIPISEIEIGNQSRTMGYHVVNGFAYKAHRFPDGRVLTGLYQIDRISHLANPDPDREYEYPTRNAIETLRLISPNLAEPGWITRRMGSYPAGLPYEPGYMTGFQMIQAGL